MPDQQTPRFEQRWLEEDIKRLSEEVERLREMPEHRAKSNQELLRQSVVNYSASSAPAAPAPVPPKDSQSPLPSYAKDISPAMKLEVEQLLEKALTQGIEKASSEAARSNPYVMDIFHDALTTRLYPELKKRGFLD